MKRRVAYHYWYITVMVCAISCSGGLLAQQPVKVFILAGQSNMAGHGEIYANPGIRATGTLEYEVKNDPSGIYKNIVDSKGLWKQRKDVWVSYTREQNELKKGELTVGYGSADTEIGPEFQFGNVMGDHFTNQVLVIKTAWGGKSLGVDFRPPSSGGSTGFFYKKMLEEIHAVLDHLPAQFKHYKGQGFKIAGFVWNQGWNDAGDSVLYKQYKINMVNFIKDVRHDLQIPQLPFVIINSGQGGLQPAKDKWMRSVQTNIAMAQLEAAASPEFAHNVMLVNSQPFWKDSSESPVTEIHHYNRNAGTYFMMGNAAANAMIKLLEIVQQ